MTAPCERPGISPASDEAGGRPATPVPPDPRRLTGRHAATGIVFGLLAMTVWSIGDGVWKHVLATVAIPTAFFVTYAASSVALLACVRLQRRPLRLGRPARAAIYSVLYFLELAVFFVALARMPIVDLFVIILTTPLFVLVVARIVIGERLSRLQVASVFTGFVGAAIVAAGNAPSAAGAAPELTLAGSAWPAVWFAFANVILNGSKIVFVRWACRDEDPFTLTVCFNLFVALATALPGIGGITGIPTPLLGALIAAGLLQVIGQLLYLRALQIEQAPLVAATQYSQVIWAVLIGTLFFAEPLRTAAVAGALLVVASGLMLYGRYLPTLRAPALRPPAGGRGRR